MASGRGTFRSYGSSYRRRRRAEEWWAGGRVGQTATATPPSGSVATDPESWGSYVPFASKLHRLI